MNATKEGPTNEAVEPAAMALMRIHQERGQAEREVRDRFLAEIADVLKKHGFRVEHCLVQPYGLDLTLYRDMRGSEGDKGATRRYNPATYRFEQASEQQDQRSSGVLG